jgi:ribose 5-phosphate isomerase RpiB
MNANHQNRKASPDGAVLRWNGPVVTAEDLRQSLNGQRELVLSPRAVITPSAADHLRSHGVRIVRQEEASKPGTEGGGLSTATWGYAQEHPEPLVGSVVHSLKRDGMNFKELAITTDCNTACGLARAAAECVIRGECHGVVVFCQDPGLVCCVANKVKGLRAVPALSVPHASRASKLLGANFLAVTMSGKTFYELRQLLRTLCTTEIACSEPVAAILKEVEGACQCQNAGSKKGACQCGGGHAHR